MAVAATFIQKPGGIPPFEPSKEAHAMNGRQILASITIATLAGASTGRAESIPINVCPAGRNGVQSAA